MDENNLGKSKSFNVANEIATQRQLSISMGQAINLASDLVLKNEFRQPRNTDLSSMEYCAKMKATLTHIFCFIKDMQQTGTNVTGALKPVESVKQPQPAPVQKQQFVA